MTAEYQDGIYRRKEVGSFCWLLVQVVPGMDNQIDCLASWEINYWSCW